MARFMDAQIGVRALADSFRYNVLPDIVKALHLDNGALVHGNDFEDLPKYEQLAMLVCHILCGRRVSLTFGIESGPDRAQLCHLPLFPPRQYHHVRLARRVEKVDSIRRRI